METIFAEATAPGRAGVSILRVSGESAFAAARVLCGDLPSGRGLRRLRAGDGTVIDEALVLRFEAGRSFTGEPVVEFQTHGSRAVVAAVLAELGRQPGLRLAEPGEFTRRALENGRLDLTQVEGLADLIDAQTEAQRRQALRVFDGDLSRRVAGWREDLIRARSLIEATIDFADEDVPVDVWPEVSAILTRLADDWRAELAGSGVAERVRSGFEVAVIGRPNSGKSTLINYLAGREVAITSQVAGTTRDVLEVSLDLGGLPVTVLDTAGLRDSADIVERIGVDRARARATAADLRVHLVDPGEGPSLELRPGDLVLVGKADLAGRAGDISGLTGHGMERLVSHLRQTLEERVAGAGSLVRARHRRAVAEALEAVGTPDHEVPAEVLAERLRDATRVLDVLIGKVDVEDLLGEIFASFCIGK